MIVYDLYQPSGKLVEEELDEETPEETNEWLRSGGY